MATKDTVTFQFALGARVRDRVTEYVGIIDQRKQMLNGCLQYSIQGPINPDDPELKPGWWMDEEQLEFVDKGLNTKPVEPTGRAGPMTPVSRESTSR